MLESMYNALLETYPDPPLAWDHLVDFIACNHYAPLLSTIRHGFDWLFSQPDLAHKLTKHYSPALLHSDKYDHLGDLYCFHIEANSCSSTESPECPTHDYLTTAELLLSKTDREITILDPAAGTGGLLLAISEQAPNAYLFGVEKDLRKARIAFTNFLIHRIPAFILHADPELHETDFGLVDGRYNWDLANSWYSQMDKLRPIVRPHDSPPKKAREKKRR